MDASKIAVENDIHICIADAAQAMFNKYGICIESVEFQWTDVSTLSRTQQVVCGVSMKTRTTRKGIQ